MAKRELKPRTRCGQRWTEAKFWAFVRSGLRSLSTRWAPIYDVKLAARRKSKSKNKRLKWEYQCNECKSWFPDKEVKVDHIVPTGPISSFEEAGRFLELLLCESEGLQVLCNECHSIKTAQERAGRSGSNSE